MATLRARRPKRVRRQGPPLRVAMPTFAFCAGLQVDAQTVLDYVRAHPILCKTPVVRPLFSRLLLSGCENSL